MSIIDLVWYLNINESTKYMIFIWFFVLIMLYCVYKGKKKKNSKKTKRSLCEKNYDTCMKKNLMNGTNNFCYPCFDNGQAPDFFYDPEVGLRTYN